MRRSAWAALALLLPAVLGLLPPGARAEPVYVPAGDVSGVWDNATAGYVVLGNLTVPAGETLTVLPGVRVLFDEGLGLRVLGTLLVLGEEGARVVFAGNATLPPPGFWRGIAVEGPGTVLLNATVEDADRALKVVGTAVEAVGFAAGHAVVGVEVDGGTFRGDLVAVTGAETAAVLATNASVTLSQSLLLDSTHGVEAVDSTVVLRDSEIATPLLAAARLDRATLRLVNSTFSGTIDFLDGTAKALEQQRLTVKVRDVFGTAVGGAAVTLEGSNGTSPLAVTTGTTGSTGPLELTRTTLNLSGETLHVPLTVTAEKAGDVTSTTTDLAVDGTLVLPFAGDVVPPSAKLSASELAVDEDVPATLDASPSTDNDPNFPATGNFTWNFGDGSKAVTLFGRIASHAWETPGNYTVTLRVRDAAGNVDTDYLAVSVRDRTPPEVEIRATAVVAVGKPTTLRANATDNAPGFDGTLANYTWTVTGPANATLYGATVNHTYPLPGRYAVTVTVRDASGNLNATTKQVDVAAPPPPSADLTAPILALSAAAFAAGAWLGGTDRGWSSLFLLVAPLYTRLRKEEVLDQFTRGQIFGYVRVHPGDSFTDLKRNLQLENGVLAHHLDVLEKENLIRSRTKGSRRLYFPLEAVPPEDGALHDLQQRMLEVLQGRPGLTVRELADALGVSRQLAVYHLRALTSRGLARVERQGIKMQCFATGPPAVPGFPPPFPPRQL